MSQFDALDFNVCRSEEVMSFFWRSVYIVSQNAKDLVRFIDIVYSVVAYIV